MRRLAAVLKGATICGALLSLGTLATILDPGPSSLRLAGIVTDMLAPAAALAQTTMKFRAVPAESVAELQRPRRHAVTPVPAAPANPPEGAPVPPVPESDADTNVPEAANRSGDLVRFGSDVHVIAGQTVRGDVVAMGGDITVDGHVRGDVVAMGGDVSLGPSGQVDGQVVTLGGQLHESPGSHVGGQRVSAGGLSRRWARWPVLHAVNSGIKAVWDVCKMLIFLLIAWGITQLAPVRTRAAVDSVKREPLMAFGIGLLAWALVIPSIVAMVLVVAILCITIIGIPLAIAVLFAYVLALMLLVIWGYVVGAIVLGERVSAQLGRTAGTLTMMAVWGIVAVTAVRFVGHLFGALPMGGGPGGLLVILAKVASGVLMTIGAGAILRTQLHRDTLGRLWPGSRRAESSYPTGSGVTPPPVPPPPPPPPYTPGGFTPPHTPGEPPPPAGPASPYSPGGGS